MVKESHSTCKVPRVVAIMVTAVGQDNLGTVKGFNLL